jgi:hypothetical protein
MTVRRFKSKIDAGLLVLRLLPGAIQVTARLQDA